MKHASIQRSVLMVQTIDPKYLSHNQRGTHPYLMADSIMLPENDQLVERLAQTLKTRLGARLKRLILFGSRARGDQSADSDYDCLVVVDQVDAAILKAIDQVAGEFLFRDNAVCALIPISQTAYETETCHPLLMNVAGEGVAL